MSHAATPDSTNKLMKTSHSVVPIAARSGAVVAAVLLVDQRQQQTDRQIEDEQQAEEMAGARVQRQLRPAWAGCWQPEPVQLLGEAAVGLAQIVATRFQRAAQRADRARVRGTHRHVVPPEHVLADRAADLRLALRQPCSAGARGSSGPCVAHAISGAATKATTNATSGERICGERAEHAEKREARRSQSTTATRPRRRD